MRRLDRFYIDGAWVEPSEGQLLPVENPATEEIFAQVAQGSPADVDRAVSAARRAFVQWSASSIADRGELLDAIIAQYEARADDLAEAVCDEMGAPLKLAREAQVPIGLAHLHSTRAALAQFPFEQAEGAYSVLREGIGVCALITPWNWPLNQITCKVAPALAAGCTMVLKPSEISPLSGQIFAEIMHAAGVPDGVFNLVQGDGQGVGKPLVSHIDVDMVSFTGSTRGGIEVARAAASRVKRVSQELGGKSAAVLIDDASLPEAVQRLVAGMMVNSGQSCNAPTRLLVPHHRMDEAAAVAAATANSLTVGPPRADVRLGPVVSLRQFNQIQGFIEQGMAEGARLVAGGPGRPAGLTKGHFVRPTVFSHVSSEMAVAREEIFGPVVVIIGYDDLEEAVGIANGSDYGLAAYVEAADKQVAAQLARQLRAGQVSINGAWDLSAPFGGYRMSGNGRERGIHGIHDYVEIKALIGLEG
jgi:aldehyde dehydrogenase (NAD+)